MSKSDEKSKNFSFQRVEEVLLASIWQLYLDKVWERTAAKKSTLCVSRTWCVPVKTEKHIYKGIIALLRKNVIVA